MGDNWLAMGGLSGGGGHRGTRTGRVRGSPWEQDGHPTVWLTGAHGLPRVPIMDASVGALGLFCRFEQKWMDPSPQTFTYLCWIPFLGLGSFWGGGGTWPSDGISVDGMVV